MSYEQETTKRGLGDTNGVASQPQVPATTPEYILHRRDKHQQYYWKHKKQCSSYMREYYVRNRERINKKNLEYYYRKKSCKDIPQPLTKKLRMAKNLDWFQEINWRVCNEGLNTKILPMDVQNNYWNELNRRVEAKYPRCLFRK